MAFTTEKSCRDIGATQAMGHFIHPVESLATPPPDLVMLRCSFDIKHYQSTYYPLLSIAQPPEIGRSALKRQAEFLVGRFLAKTALKQLGAPSLACHLDIGTRGEPLWPHGVVGSISHRHGMALCAVAHQSDYPFLGVDIEQWLSPELAQALQADIVSPDEITVLKATSLPYAQALTLTFSAKESLYKALYPEVKQFFDFFVAEVVELNPLEGALILRLTTTLSNHHQQGQCYHCQILSQQEVVMTLIMNSVQQQPLFNPTSVTTSH